MSQSRFLIVNGLKLHYLDFGGDGKPPLFCIHGLTGNAHNFDALAPRLATKYHVCSLDVRGRGDSQWGPPQDYTAENYVRDVTAILDRLGIERVNLIGTSMGGIISMLFASASPDRVERMVLNDIGPEIDPAGGMRIRSYVGESPSSFKDLAEVADYYRRIFPPVARLAEDVLEQWVKWSVKPTAEGGLTWKMDPAVRRPAPAGGAQTTFDLWGQYAKITAEILVVRGAESDILAAGTAEKMCRVLPRTTVVEVPGVGHAPALVEPEAWAAIGKFLAL